MDKQQLLTSLRVEGFSKQTIKAFEKVKREDFVSEELRENAYEDNPLPIGNGQTISQPYTIAFMLDLLELKDNLDILEIGSGSGYALSLINQITKNSKITGVERIKELAEKSKKTLDKNIKIINKDGTKLTGKFDRILVSASASELPNKLIKQLKNNGILVIPIKNSIFQIKKISNKIVLKEFEGFIFVPLIRDNI